MTRRQSVESPFARYAAAHIRQMQSPGGLESAADRPSGQQAPPERPQPVRHPPSGMQTHPTYCSSRHGALPCKLYAWLSLVQRPLHLCPVTQMQILCLQLHSPFASGSFRPPGPFSAPSPAEVPPQHQQSRPPTGQRQQRSPPGPPAAQGHQQPRTGRRPVAEHRQAAPALQRAATSAVPLTLSKMMAAAAAQPRAAPDAGEPAACCLSWVHLTARPRVHMCLAHSLLTLAAPAGTSTSRTVVDRALRAAPWQAAVPWHGSRPCCNAHIQLPSCGSSLPAADLSPLAHCSPAASPRRAGPPRFRDGPAGPGQPQTGLLRLPASGGRRRLLR